MTHNYGKIFLFLGVQSLLSALALIARADGNTITRPATPDEKTYIVATKLALKNGLPALPSGWSVDHATDLNAEEIVSFPGKESAIEVRYKADFKRVEGIQERQALRDKAIADSAAAQRKMQQLSSAIQQKIRAANKAREDGERSAYEKAKSDMEQTQKEYDTLMEGPENPVKMVNAAEYELQRDTAIHVNAAANSRSAAMSGPITYIEVPHAAIAVRRDYEDKARASKVLLLFGDWKIEKFGAGQTQSMVATREPAKTDKLTAIYTVAMELEADKERMSELIVAVNGSGVAGVISPP